MKIIWSSVLFVLLVHMALAQDSHPWHPIMQHSGSMLNCPDEKMRSELSRKADKGDVDAEDLLGRVNLSTCLGDNNVARGLELLERAAQKGNVHAAVALADAYRSGKSGPPDAQKAASWDQKAAERGDARAQNDLGIAYHSGAGVSKDDVRAAELFRAAAEQNLTEAEYNLGTMCDLGLGIAQNYQDARKWYLKAAKHDNALAEYRLGMLLEQGLGGEKDSATAMTWFKKAAEHGSEDAQVRIGQKRLSEAKTVDSGYFQYAIGMQMLTGNGVKKDEAHAVAFLEKSAEAGFPPAMTQLGRMFANGQSVPKDEMKARKYFEQAIARDDQYYVAYNSLAWLYVTAEDVKLRDPQKALEYAQKAVTLTSEHNAAELDTLAHAYFQLSNIDKAIETESKAAALAPTDDFIQKTLQEYKGAKEHQPVK